MWSYQKKTSEAFLRAYLKIFLSRRLTTEIAQAIFSQVEEHEVSEARKMRLREFPIPAPQISGWWLSFEFYWQNAEKFLARTIMKDGHQETFDDLTPPLRSRAWLILETRLIATLNSFMLDLHPHFKYDPSPLNILKPRDVA